MDFTIVVSLVLIASGVFRLYLVRSGKLPQALSFQQYFPYVFIGAGLLMLVVALLD
jgi:hypothetical protein